MPRLIIGHVTHDAAHVWVRGEARYPVAHVRVDDGSQTFRETLDLEARHAHTGVACIEGLKPDTRYEVRVHFARQHDTPESRWIDYGHCEGCFRTFPEPGRSQPFTFMLGSCNLHGLGVVADPDAAYEELTDRAVEHDARFMIHAGDQIYYDIPYPWKAPDIEEYRQKYLDAWGDSRPTRHFLTRLPHYMILDDHELTDGFARDFDPPASGVKPRAYRDLATKVYREFVHVRQPRDFGEQALYYTFRCGQAHFFVTDARTERYAHDPEDSRIVSDEQLEHLKGWLSEHRDAMKFVVTSVPFVGEVRNDDGRWSAPAFRHQKEALIDHVAREGIEKLVFLTGDMHCSYHAALEIGDGDRTRRIHELMSSPINQLQKASLDEFTSGPWRETPGGASYRTRLTRESFYDAHSNAMLVSVDGDEVAWQIFRTKERETAMQGRFTP